MWYEGDCERRSTPIFSGRLSQKSARNKSGSLGRRWVSYPTEWVESDPDRQNARRIVEMSYNFLREGGLNAHPAD